MANLKNFSIPKSNSYLMVRVLLIVISIDLMYGLYAFMLVAIRNTLELNATSGALLWLGFIAKIFFTGYAVYITMNRWLGTRYFVIGNDLIVQKVNRTSTEEDVYSLNKLRGIKVEETMMAKQLNSGTIKISLVDADLMKENDIRLFDVNEPDKIAKILKSYNKGS